MHATSTTRRQGELGWRIVGALSLAAGVAILALFGCRDELTSDIDTNRLPDTYLTGAPAESSVTLYRVHLFWYGNDADGFVTDYEYAITDSFLTSADTIAYAHTTRTDSVFLIPVGEAAQVMGHRFYVRAIDNDGGTDPEPAWTFFGVADPSPPIPEFTRSEAWTGSPANPVIIKIIDSIELQIPSDTIPAGSNVRFHWTATDVDSVLLEDGTLQPLGRITGYQYLLFPKQPALRVGPGDTTAVYTDLQSGKYEFRLWAYDDAGFSGLDPAVRTFVWNMDPVVRFETGVNASGDTLPHLFATSEAWSGQREYFLGDTVSLVKIGSLIKKPTLVMPYAAHDPDGEVVTQFEARTGLGQWRKDIVDTTLQRIVLASQGSGDIRLEVRCKDGYGRLDGSPPLYKIYINRAPGLVDTIGYSGSEAILQYPLPDQIISLDSLAAWNYNLPVRVRGVDPDSTTDIFSYDFKFGPSFNYEIKNVRPGANAIASVALPIVAAYRVPGRHEIGVRISELAVGTGARSTESVYSVRFQ
ncbi:MAG: fibronectin type III domain-containing protein [Candidatus Eisenbacteria bacterium]